MTDNILTVLKAKFREIITDRTQHLAAGSAKDFVEYKHVAGVIEGLELAERELLKLNKRIEEDF